VSEAWRGHSLALARAVATYLRACADHERWLGRAREELLDLTAETLAQAARIDVLLGHRGEGSAGVLDAWHKPVCASPGRVGPAVAQLAANRAGAPKPTSLMDTDRRALHAVLNAEEFNALRQRLPRSARRGIDPAPSGHIGMIVQIVNRDDCRLASAYGHVPAGADVSRELSRLEARAYALLSWPQTVYLPVAYKLIRYDLIGEEGVSMPSKITNPSRPRRRRRPNGSDKRHARHLKLVTDEWLAELTEQRTLLRFRRPGPLARRRAVAADRGRPGSAPVRPA
jgi:hypothetical protein